MKRRKTFAALREDLQTSFQIALRESLKQTSVTSALAVLVNWSEDNLKQRYGSRARDPETVERVRKMAAAGWNRNAVAKKIGLSINTVQRIADREGLLFVRDVRGKKSKKR